MPHGRAHQSLRSVEIDDRRNPQGCIEVGSAVALCIITLLQSRGSTSFWPLKALERIKDEAGVFIYNLGTGTGSSLLEVVKAFEKACGKQIPYQILPSRAGDIAENCAAPELAEKELSWKTTRNLDDMMAHSWNWQSRNPKGF